MPTFIFLTSRLKAEMCDLESFYLYILQVRLNSPQPRMLPMDSF
jgi:hypothetical protein